MARGNGDAANTKPCDDCGTNRVPLGTRFCSDCRSAQDRLLGDLKDPKKDD